jgi:hypothetical protein
MKDLKGRRISIVNKELQKEDKVKANKLLNTIVNSVKKDVKELQPSIPRHGAYNMKEFSRINQAILNQKDPKSKRNIKKQ